MKRLLYSMLILAAFVMALSGCKKGDTGPAGTANVLYSAWMDTNPWVASTTSTGAGKKTFYFDITASGVTQEVLDNGNVLVYAKFISDPDGAGAVKLLPSIYYNIGGTGVEYRFQQALFLNKIRVVCDVLPTGTPANSNKIRFIIIPGGTATSGRSAGPRYETMSYAEVCKSLNIAE